uniref:Uncharacterized protein n=1 Tax=Arundo donax TaxID=35708 RepID=A0A0A9T5D5_ARUDO
MAAWLQKNSNFVGFQPSSPAIAPMDQGNRRTPSHQSYTKWHVYVYVSEKKMGRETVNVLTRKNVLAFVHRLTPSRIFRRTYRNNHECDWWYISLV